MSKRTAGCSGRSAPCSVLRAREQDGCEVLHMQTLSTPARGLRGGGDHNAPTGSPAGSGHVLLSTQDHLPNGTPKMLLECWGERRALRLTPTCTERLTVCNCLLFVKSRSRRWRHAAGWVRGDHSTHHVYKDARPSSTAQPPPSSPSLVLGRWEVSPPRAHRESLESDHPQALHPPGRARNLRSGRSPRASPLSSGLQPERRHPSPPSAQPEPSQPLSSEGRSPGTRGRKVTLSLPDRAAFPRLPGPGARRTGTPGMEPKALAGADNTTNKQTKRKKKRASQG